MNGSNENHFWGFNGVRCWAALAVIAGHVEVAKHHLRLNYSVPVDVIDMAHEGVILFFVLSGFLITTLLLSEQNRLGTIAVGDFYRRRLLRIVPAYFVVGLIGFAVMPHFMYHHGFLKALYPDSDASISPWKSVILYSVIMPNVAEVCTFLPSWLSMTWSIGVEEQFYLLWPWILLYRSTIIAGLIGALICFKLGWLFFLSSGSALAVRVTQDPVLSNLNNLFVGWRLESLSCGALGAFGFLTMRASLARTILHPWIAKASLPLLIILLVEAGTYSGLLTVQVWSIFFTIIVLNLAHLQKPYSTSWLSVDHPLYDYLGRISYGLYLYHSIVIAIAFFLLDHFLGWTFFKLYAVHPLLMNGLIYGFIFSMTVALAAISYHGIERPFLKMKNRFEPQGQAIAT